MELGWLVALVVLTRWMMARAGAPAGWSRVPVWIASEGDGVLQRLSYSPTETTAARVLAEVSAQVEVRDLTLEEPAIEDIVRTLYHSG